MKFDAWWTACGPLHLGVLNSQESFCGLVETLHQGDASPWYDSDTHTTTPERVRLHTKDSFPAHERYCKRCARHALRAMEDA